MKQVLILFDQESISTGKAYPRQFVDELSKFSHDCLYVDASYDEVIYSISNTSVRVTLHKTGQDIADFAAIYFRRFHCAQARALAVALYAQAKGVPVLDSEIITRKDSISKLTQYMKMALNGIPIPATYCTSGSIFQEIITTNNLPFSYPYIMKIADATRGADNELISTQEEALRFVTQHLHEEILAQEFIDNDGDYRVWTFGEEPGVVFYRQRDLHGTSHKNNTSQGARISLVDHQQIVSPVYAIALTASRLFNREISGVDIVQKKGTDADYRVFEVNRAPQLEYTEYADIKARGLARFIEQVANREVAVYANKMNPDIIGVTAKIDFSGYKSLKQIPARIDTGARTSSLWASDIKVKDGIATFKLFGRGSQWYTGKVVKRKVLELREVTSSTGHVQQRYVVNMSIRMLGRRLNAKFTLSDRSTQTYPILIGRNTLRGNFLVDSGNPGEAMLYKYPEEAAEFNVNEGEAV